MKVLQTHVLHRVNSSLLPEYLRYVYVAVPAKTETPNTKHTDLSNKIQSKNHFCLKAASSCEVCVHFDVWVVFVGVLFWPFK